MADSSGNNISKQSIKVISESCGNPPIDDDCSQVIADEVNARLREIVQDGLKFMRHSKRSKLTRTDIDLALKFKNIEPVYGFSSKDFVPFRYASGGGKSIYFQEDKELNLTEFIASRPPPMAPLDTHIRAHWLSIDGTQPFIPENPDPDTLQKFKRMSSDDTIDDFIPKKVPAIIPLNFQDSKLHIDKKSSKDAKTKEKTEETSTASFLKPLTGHELSLEQQLFFREITEACVSNNEEKRKKALECLHYDPGLYQLLPRFSKFIAEGIRANVHETEGAVLVYLLRMMESLLQNETLNLEKYLHELMPAVLSCVVNKQVASEDPNNRLVIQHYATSLITKICSNKVYNSPVNNVQSRITRLMANALQDETLPIHTHYGALYLMINLCNSDALKQFLLPVLKERSDSIEFALIGSNDNDKLFAEKLRDLLVQSLVPILPMSDESLDAMLDKYGYIGRIISHNAQYLKQAHSRGLPIDTVLKYSIPPTARSTTTVTDTAISSAKGITNSTPSLTSTSTHSKALDTVEPTNPSTANERKDVPNPVTTAAAANNSDKTVSILTDSSDTRNNLMDTSMSEISEINSETSISKTFETTDESAMEIESSNIDDEGVDHEENNSAKSSDSKDPDAIGDVPLNVLATTEVADVELMEEESVSSDSEEFVDSADVTPKSNLDTDKIINDDNTKILTRDINKPLIANDVARKTLNTGNNSEKTTKDDAEDAVSGQIKGKSDHSQKSNDGMTHSLTGVDSAEKIIKDELTVSSPLTSSSSDSASQEYLPISNDPGQKTTNDHDHVNILGISMASLSSDESDASCSVPSPDDKQSITSPVDIPAKETLACGISSNIEDKAKTSIVSSAGNERGVTSGAKVSNKPIASVEETPSEGVRAEATILTNNPTSLEQEKSKIADKSSTHMISASLSATVDKPVASATNNVNTEKVTLSPLSAEDKSSVLTSSSSTKEAEMESAVEIDINAKPSNTELPTPSSSFSSENTQSDKTDILSAPKRVNNDEYNEKTSTDKSLTKDDHKIEEVNAGITSRIPPSTAKVDHEDEADVSVHVHTIVKTLINTEKIVEQPLDISETEDASKSPTISTNNDSQSITSQLPSSQTEDEEINTSDTEQQVSSTDTARKHLLSEGDASPSNMTSVQNKSHKNQTLPPSNKESPPACMDMQTENIKVSIEKDVENCSSTEDRTIPVISPPLDKKSDTLVTDNAAEKSLKSSESTGSKDNVAGRTEQITSVSDGVTTSQKTADSPEMRVSITRKQSHEDGNPNSNDEFMDVDSS